MLLYWFETWSPTLSDEAKFRILKTGFLGKCTNQCKTVRVASGEYLNS